MPLCEHPEERVQKPGDDQQLFAPEVKVPANGYAYIYVSNQSEAETVYFDNLSVLHERGRLLEETHYYADGLKMAGICSRAFDKLPNWKNYQGGFAEEDEETSYNEFDLRHYDPQIGRWISTDPKDEFASPYVGMGNDPVNNVDPDGGGIFDWIGKLFGGGSCPNANPTGANSSLFGGGGGGFLGGPNTAGEALGNFGMNIIAGAVGQVAANLISGLPPESNSSALTDYRPQEEKKPQKEKVATFTGAGLDLDGGRDAYTTDDEGTDYLDEGGENGVYKDKKGNKVLQKGSTNKYVSKTSFFKNPDLPDDDQDKYYDPEKDAYIVGTPKLRKLLGIKKSPKGSVQKVSVTYKKNGEIVKTITATVGDNGNDHNGNLEMSPEALRQLGLSPYYEVPKGTNANNNYRRYTNPKYKGVQEVYDKKGTKTIKAKIQLEVRLIN